jgi:hypothetical protein
VTATGGRAAIGATAPAQTQRRDGALPARAAIHRARRTAACRRRFFCGPLTSVGRRRLGFNENLANLKIESQKIIKMAKWHPCCATVACTLLMVLTCSRRAGCFTAGNAVTGVRSMARNSACRRSILCIRMKNPEFWEEADKEGRSRDPIRAILNLFNTDVPTTDEIRKPAKKAPVNRSYNNPAERRDAMSGVRFAFCISLTALTIL